VTAQFDDGTSATGTVLVGADGSASLTRKLIAPETHALVPLPIRGIGFCAVITPENMAPMLEIDPLLFQAVHPVTNDYLWWSVLDTPQTSGHGGYNVQLVLSWHSCTGVPVPGTSAERLAMCKQRAESFAPVLRKVIQSISDDTVTNEIRLADWDIASWPDQRGQVTLAGDAAHAMTMCQFLPTRDRSVVTDRSFGRSWRRSEPWHRRCSQSCS
jgi:2-polyprenyl-6-methoxyphenol hydroxylase-like FAD-dependent oxidoreductase